MNRMIGIIKGFGSRKASIVIKTGIAFLLLAALMSGVVFASYSDNVNKGLAESLIRLHIIANSDTEEDQALKRDVRDVIIAGMKDLLKDSKDVEHTRSIINDNLGLIEDMARKEITRQGKDYPVKVYLGSYPFPTKVYGDITLPAGDYEALRVVIGNGDGANWWCVLFPPLCFVDATHGTVPDSVKNDLKNVLTDEEYSIVASASNDSDIPIKVRFKIIEFFQSSRIKFSGVLSRLFK